LGFRGDGADQEEIKRLTLLIDKFKRLLFGRKSEKLSQQIDQLELELEELHIKQGEQISATYSVAHTLRLLALLPWVAKTMTRPFLMESPNSP
jgi:hypothetical protein